MDQNSRSINNRNFDGDINQDHADEDISVEQEEESYSVEKIFMSKEVPAWQKQLTLRALLVSFVLSVLFAFLVMKLNLTTGIIPAFNVSSGILGFFLVKAWTKFPGLGKQPFTRQENTVIQTCVVASSGIAYSGGFGSYVFGMSEAIATNYTESNDLHNIKNPSLKWMIGFLFVVSFLGLFIVVPLRKIMIIDLRLTYPSGTATGHLINSLHTPQGSKVAKKQVRTLWKFFSFSFLWGFFQWFSTAGVGCGFAQFPTFGLKAYQNRFFFDFSSTYVGVGMVCPHLINVSVLLGAILSWGIMWPLINDKKGDWYSPALPPTSLQGIQGYRVFISIAMILSDGLYNFVKVLGRTLLGLYQQIRGKNSGSVLPVGSSSFSSSTPTVSFDDERRTQHFVENKIPTWFVISGYMVLAIISAATLPHFFHPLKWYYIIVMYIFSPTVAFCNAYGCGLTDWSLAAAYGKLAVFLIGAWVGASRGGVLAGLAASGVVMNIVSSASDLIQDFKTGYMTLASPMSMFVSQVIGTAIGCVVAPCVFWTFYKSYPDLGTMGSQYPAPFATMFRGIAILGVEGFPSLPKHCLTICYVCFIAAIFINALRDIVGSKWARFIPIPMAMALPFSIGAHFTIDMCVGSLIRFIWETVDKAKAGAFGPAVVSGLICGDGVWTVASLILALVGVKAPICMKFLSRKTNAKVDTFFLGNQSAVLGN